MAEFPSLEIFTDAYLADTGDLTDAEHGAYFLMLFTAWRRPDNALINDMAWLQRALGAHCSNMHGNHFQSVVPGLLNRFWQLGPDGKWRQRRLEKEREFRRNFSGKQREKANKRWSSSNDINDLFDAAASNAAYAPHPTYQKEVIDRPVLASARDARAPPPSPKKAHANGGNGGGNGASVTLMSSEQKIAVFQINHLVPHLGPDAWGIIGAATDENDPLFARSIALCKAAARKAGKGWPRNWPITPKKP